MIAYALWSFTHLYFSPLIQGPSWFPTFWPLYLLACLCSFWRRLLASTLLLEVLECGSLLQCSKVNQIYILRILVRLKTTFSILTGHFMTCATHRVFVSTVWHHTFILHCFRCGPGCCCSFLLAQYLLHCYHCLGHLLFVQLLHCCEYLICKSTLFPNKYKNRAWILKIEVFRLLTDFSHTEPSRFCWYYYLLTFYLWGRCCLPVSPI